jgi:hypothetical protein
MAMFVRWFPYFFFVPPAMWRDSCEVSSRRFQNTRRMASSNVWIASPHWDRPSSWDLLRAACMCIRLDSLSIGVSFLQSVNGRFGAGKSLARRSGVGRRRTVSTRGLTHIYHGVRSCNQMPCLSKPCAPILACNVAVTLEWGRLLFTAR